MMQLKYLNIHGDDYIKFSTLNILKSIEDFGYGKMEFHTGEIEAILKQLSAEQAKVKRLREWGNHFLKHSHPSQWNGLDELLKETEGNDG